MSFNKTARKILKHILLFALLIVLSAALGAGSVIIWNSFSKYHYNGALYSDSEDYVNNYGYNYFKETNKAQEELYIELYHVAKDFEHKNKNLIKGVGSDYGTLYKIYTKDSTLSFDELKQVFVVFEKENPEFYFLTTMHNSVKEYVEFEIHKDYLKAKERKRINSLIENRLLEVDEIVNKCTTTYDKVMAVSNYIVNNMKYARDENGEPSREKWAHNVVGFFERGEGVCETFCETLKLMLDRYGISCKEAWSENHAWNVVEIDGYNYVFDLTNKLVGYTEKTYFQLLDYEYENTMYPLYNMAKAELSSVDLTLKEDGQVIAVSHSMDYIMSLFNNKDYEITVQNDKNHAFYLSEINTSYKTLTFKSTGTYGVNVYLNDDLVINKNVTFYRGTICGLGTLYINNATLNFDGFSTFIQVKVVGNEHSTLNFNNNIEAYISETIDINTIITSKPLVISKSANIGDYIGDYICINLTFSNQNVIIDKYESNKIAINTKTIGNKLIIEDASITSEYLEIYYLDNTKEYNVKVDFDWSRVKIIKQ